jgi:hypothetical protein
MPMHARSSILPTALWTATAFLMCASVPATGQELQAPKDWIARPERFVEMPPGWHLTAGRGVILYNPAATAAGNFEVESEGFLFDPKGAESMYGLILGGRALDTDAPRYVAFEIGTMGDFALRTVEAYESTDLVTGTHPAILPWTGEGPTVKNVLGLVADDTVVRFLVNGEVVAELPRADVDPRGIVGFRIDAGLNTHITTLDIRTDAGTRHWAPVPEEEN